MNRERPINVLIVDDSKVAQMFLTRLLESDPHIRVIGAADDGQAALDFVTKTTPDVVLMDIHMPRMDGFEATRRIMETYPVPIIIYSAITDIQEVTTAFRLMEAGAVGCIEKPRGYEHPDFDAIVVRLLETVKLMSEVKVIRRWPRSRHPPASIAHGDRIKSGSGSSQITLIGIGTSTGGPPALQTILADLPKNFPVPILIVQHIAPGFLPGLAEWLNQTVGLRIHIATHGVHPLPGHVYLAPDGSHMEINATGHILLTKKKSESGPQPAAAYLFRSLAEVCGPAAIGVLLTGMGKDGAAELKLMKDRGAVTIAQDRDSSVVHGMPGEAIALGGATQILPLEDIADVLVTLVTHHNGTLRH